MIGRIRHLAYAVSACKWRLQRVGQALIAAKTSEKKVLKEQIVTKTQEGMTSQLLTQSSPCGGCRCQLWSAMSPHFACG